MDLNSILASIQSSGNPAVIYIVIAVVIFIGAILLRSILATLITFAGVAIVIVLILYLSGADLSKFKLPDNLQLPNIAKFIPGFGPKTDGSTTTTSTSTTTEVPTNNPLPQLAVPGNDSLTQAIKNDRAQRGMLSGPSLIPSNNSGNDNSNPLSGLFGK